MKITVTVITPQDYEKFNAVGMNAEACLADRVKLICQDDAGHVAESFMKQDEFDRLGLAYIEQHAKLEHSAVCDEWFMKCSQNFWYNDLEHNPEKVIKVMFVGIEDGTGREVYRGVETQRYYLREVHARQLFAKWCVESAGYGKMVESQDPTCFSSWEIRRRRLYMTTGTALLPTRISSTKTSEKRLANSSFILKM